jgi:hypothetical protein
VLTARKGVPKHPRPHRQPAGLLRLPIADRRSGQGCAGHRLAERPRADRPREHPLRVNGAILGMHKWEIDRKFDETCAEPGRSIVAFPETPS